MLATPCWTAACWAAVVWAAIVWAAMSAAADAQGEGCCAAAPGSWNGYRDDSGVLFFPDRGPWTSENPSGAWRPDPLADFAVVALGTVQDQVEGTNSHGRWIVSTVRMASRIKGDPPARFRVLEFVPGAAADACAIGPILEKQRRYVFLVNPVSEEARKERDRWLTKRLGLHDLPGADYVLDDVFAVDYAYNRVWYEYWLRFPESRKPPRKPRI